MLGLAVLAVCGLYVGLALYVVQRIDSRRKFAKVLMVAVFALIPTWDIIPGQLYHQYLCKTEGGIQVYKTVEVDRTYFLPDGQPDEKKLRERLERQITTDRAFSKMFHITKDKLDLVDKQDGVLVGTATDFWYKGGWVKRQILPDALSTLCPQYPNHTIGSSLWRAVVRQQTDFQLGGK